MKKGKKIMLAIAIVLIATFGLSSFYVLREMGASPSRQELAAYEKLPYFKNGEFQSPQKMIYDFNNVRNGPMSWFRFLSQSRFAPQNELPQIKLNKNDFSSSKSDFAFYWLGHSAAIMELNGKRIIFDPVLENAAPLPFAVPRYGQTVIKRADLPQIDYVIITHNHYDHLERKTIQALKNSHFIVPLGVGAALRGWGIEPQQITELGWGDIFDHNGLKITAETAVHFSGRGLRDRNQTLWNSYVIQSGDKNIFWAGDTGYGRHFADIGQKYGSFDLAAIEIDGWNTGWPNTHMFPQEVVIASKELNSARIIPVHWAVFDLALHPWHESIDMVMEDAKDANIKVLTPKMGEKITFDSETSRWWQE